jgi:HPt (histidine-containing phosphotransfer) domain-containing protein
MTDAVIDSAVFAELQDTMGDDFAAELVATFLDEAPGMLADLAQAAEAGDAEGIRRAAHSLKSNANVFGATALANRARTLELEGDKPGAVAAIEAEYARAAVALREWLDE